MRLKFWNVQPLQHKEQKAKDLTNGRWNSIKNQTIEVGEECRSWISVAIQGKSK